MSTEENKVLYRRWIETVFNNKNLAAIEEFIDPAGIDHALPPGMPTSREGSRQFIGSYLSAFPDLHLTIEDIIAEGDKIVGRWTSSGTHQGELFGIPPTGRHAASTGIDILRIEGGKFVEHWLALDQLGMLQQLGVIPAPGQGGT
jgi:predicted ester cyclase